MTDNFRLAAELGLQLREQRRVLKLSKSELGVRAGKVREVVSRLENGQDSTISSLMAVLGGLGLALRLERVGLPSAKEVARRFRTTKLPEKIRSLMVSTGEMAYAGQLLKTSTYEFRYQRIADLLRQLQLHSDNLHRFFEQVAFSVMIRNGDAHLKSFGVLYRNAADVWLAPMFNVVTTSIYTYKQYLDGPELEDHTLALNLFAGKHKTKAYPTPNELCDFGRRVCGVSQPG